ncbi:pseudouridine synthase [Treponema pedis]|uniref:Pseudouridine synthase n=1 Tax=Treponema pedis str. T A4 TaxID=1291379 RepID=S6A3M4_9SPIR|nr:pseudouridine synthase [Treponema pedis]AGT43701.1 ribosomal small subunit pseudouridine synthase A [Treponema pedis str. T A4]
MKIRIDKLLALSGLGSRKDVKKILRKKQCCVNGERILSSSFCFELENAVITVDGEKIKIRKNVYLMLNKPKGCVTSTDDPIHKTVMEYLNPPFNNMKLFPVGRLDIDTEGLLLITDDGEITHKITSPKSGIIKTYYLEFLNEPSETEIEKYTELFKEGIILKNGYKCLPAKFEKCENKTGSAKKGFLIHITEGKFHQVKKMCLAAGNKLCYLRRIAIDGIKLDESLKTGEYRELNEKECSVIFLIGKTS